MSQHNLVEYPVKYLSAESTAVLWEYIKRYIAKQTLSLPTSATLGGSPDIQDNSTKVATTEYVVSSLNKALKEFKVMQYKGTVSSTDDLEAAETSTGSTYIAAAPFEYTMTDGTVQQISAGDMFIRNNDGWDVIISGSYSNISSTTVGDHTDTGIVVFDGNTGRFVKDSKIKVNTITQLRTDLDSSITTASADRSAKYNTLNTKIDSNVNNLSTLISNLETRVATEETKRATEDASINTKIDNDISTAISNINTKINTDITNAINQEVKDRQDADTALGTRITTEISDRQKADNTLDGKISTELNRAVEAESTIASNLATEIENRTQAVKGVASDLTTETTNRQSADSTLSTKIDNLKSYADSSFETKQAASNSIATLRNEISDAISDLKSTTFKTVNGINVENNMIVVLDTNGNIISSTVPEDGVIYLVPSENEENLGGTGISGSYVEYIKVSTSSSYTLERIGSITSDLASYYTKAEIDSKFTALPIKALDEFPYPGEENILYIRNTDSTVWMWSSEENDDGTTTTDYVQLGAKDTELRTTVSSMQTTIGSIDNTVASSTIDTLVNSVAIETTTAEDGTETVSLADFTNIKTIPNYIKALLAFEGWYRRNEDTKLSDTMTSSLATKVNVSDIIDNLTSTSANNKPLSGAQGAILNSKINTVKSEVDTKISNIGNVFSFKGTVDTPEDLPTKDTLSTLSTGDVYQVKSYIEKYTAVDSSTITVGTTDVSSYYILSDSTYSKADGLAVEDVTYYTKSYETPTDNTYATYSYIQTDENDNSTGSWVTIAVSISDITTYFSTEDDANDIITAMNELYGA